MSINNSQQISDIKTMLVKGMNGEGIESIEKTATEGFIDTYTITYTDGTKTTFDVTNGNWGIWTSAVTAAASATSITINNDAIGTTSILEVYSENASGSVVTVSDIDVSAGTAVLSFPALAEATAFILHIINGTASGGGGVATDDYLDLNNKPQINGITLTGNKTTADFGLVSTFLGDLTEWNALSTDEKKSYDHASITGTGGGEYNVNRTTGNLVLTAGIPATYPASQVMFSDGVTSVVNAIDALQAWGAEVDVPVADGHFYFSKHPIGLKRVRWALSVSTSETTYSNIVPDGYLPVVTMPIVGYNNNAGLRHAVMYTNKNIIVLSSNFAGLFGQQIYT